MNFVKYIFYINWYDQVISSLLIWQITLIFKYWTSLACIEWTLLGMINSNSLYAAKFY